MREILFRGKRIDKNNPANNGKWYEGVYFPENDITPAIIYSGTRHNHGVFVDPETVGQYTGLTDKNGKLIFEGDIVDILTENEEIGIVAYDDGGFLVKADSGFLVNADAFCVDFHSYINGTDLEVIGNIHDNPELLKGAD